MMIRTPTVGRAGKSLVPLGPSAMPNGSNGASGTHGASGNGSALVKKTPWWDALPEDFYLRQERFDVQETTTRLEVAGSAALDRVVCTLSASVMAPLFLAYSSRQAVQRALEAWQFYAQDRFLDDPASFFVPPPVVPIWRKRARLLVGQPEGGHCEDWTFRGAFEPVNPAMRERYHAHEANRTSHARFFFHGDRPRPTVIAIHGFWASPYWANAYVFDVPWLFRLGLDVVLVTMPFHGPRKGRGSLFSGHGLITPHLDQMNEAIAHTVSDVRVVMRELRARGVPAMGVTGVSLGGYLTALVASLEPGLAFAVANVPVVSLLDVVLDWHPIGEMIRYALRRHGLTVCQARRLLAVHTPLSHRPAIPREKLMVIAGAGDRLAPPAQARLLWEHWDRPRSYYFPGNHLFHFDRGAHLRSMAHFLAHAGVMERRRERSGGSTPSLDGLPTRDDAAGYRLTATDG